MPDARDESPSTSCRCTRCAADLALVSPWARYCPQCGLRLSDNRPAPVSPRAATPALFYPLDAFSSVVLRGYANAMFRLGLHYEVRHNGDEAVRCYGKASRLGNEPARARLTTIPLARRAGDAEDAPDAPHTSL